jgi:hypothetical protein
VLLLYRYLARSIVDGSPSSAAMFDEMVELTERWLADHHPVDVADRRGYAAVLVAMETGMLAMHGQLSRALGADIFGAEGHLRMTGAKIDGYSRPLLSPELAAQAHAAIERSRDTLPAINTHFWDWIWWLTTKASIGRNDLVAEHMPQLYAQLLRPMGISAEPVNIESAVEVFVARRNALEEEFGISVDRALETEVRKGIDRVLGERARQSHG